MDSKTEEKVDMVINQPLRPDVILIEDEGVPKTPPENLDIPLVPVPYVSPRHKISSGLGAFLAMAAMLSSARGRLMGGFRAGQRNKRVIVLTRNQRTESAKRKRLRKISAASRRNNRGVKGRTQMHKIR